MVVDSSILFVVGNLQPWFSGPIVFCFQKFPCSITSISQERLGKIFSENLESFYQAKHYKMWKLFIIYSVTVHRKSGCFGRQDYTL